MDSREYFRASKARTERGLTTLDIDLDTAISDQVINIPGTLFYLDKTSTGICTVEGNTGQGITRNPLLASPGFSLFNENGFADFRISAGAQPGKVLRVVIATGMAIKPGDPVQSGSVATPTVDAGLARTNGGQAYIGTGFLAAVAGQYPHIQLWNPVGSARRVIVSSAQCSSNGAALVASLYGHGTALATLANSGVSKLSAGAPASVAEIRSENNVALLGTSSMGVDFVASNSRADYEFKEPIVLTAGQGLIVRFQTVNVTMVGNFQWIEQ